MVTAEVNVGKLEAQLSQWGAELDRLIAKVEAGGADVKTDYCTSVEDLRAKHRAAHAKLEELKAAGKGKWGHFKTGVESAWNELENAFRSLKQ